MVQYSYSNNTVHMVRGPTGEKYFSPPCTVIQELCFNYFYQLLKLHSTLAFHLLEPASNAVFSPSCLGLMLRALVSITQQELLEHLLLKRFQK